MILTFTEPLAGLTPLTEFELTALEGATDLYVLRSTERAAVRLYLLNPAGYLPDYRPALPVDADEAQVFVVVTPSSDGSTVNLLAPILVDAAAGIARQVIVADEDLDSVRTPLSKAA